MIPEEQFPVDLSPETAKEQFTTLIEWMKGVADEKMRTEEGREWLRQEWIIRVP